MLVITNLLVHWMGNSDVCSLSLLESYFSGKPYQQTFIGGILNKVFIINDTMVSSLSYIISIFSFLFSAWVIKQQLVKNNVGSFGDFIRLLAK
jgi:hypothetical protein